MLQAKAYPEAACDSNHVPVIVKIRLKLRQLKKKTKRKKISLKRNGKGIKNNTLIPNKDKLQISSA